jgi:hypothetical protein
LTAGDVNCRSGHPAPHVQELASDHADGRVRVAYCLPEEEGAQGRRQCARGANIAGKRLAVAQHIFNAVTAAIAIALIGQFIWAVNQTASLVGIASNNWTLKLAVFHTFFNLTGVLVMIPFIPVLVQQLEKRVTVGAEKTEARKAGIEPTYLNEAARRSRHPGAPGSTADRPAR